MEPLGETLHPYLVVISVVARLEDHGWLRVVGRGRERISGGGKEPGEGLGWGGEREVRATGLPACVHKMKSVTSCN